MGIGCCFKAAERTRALQMQAYKDGKLLLTTGSSFEVGLHLGWVALWGVLIERATSSLKPCTDTMPL